MACAKNCNSEDVQIIFDTAEAGSFLIDAFDDTEAFITFDDDTASINIKRDSIGDVYAAGHNYVIRSFSIQIPCNDQSQALDRAWRTNPMAMCGDLEMITACCEDYSFTSVRLTSVTAPPVGTEIGVYTMSFEGVPR